MEGKEKAPIFKTSWLSSIPNNYGDGGDQVKGLSSLNKQTSSIKRQFISMQISIICCFSPYFPSITFLILSFFHPPRLNRTHEPPCFSFGLPHITQAPSDPICPPLFQPVPDMAAAAPDPAQSHPHSWPCPTGTREAGKCHLRWGISGNSPSSPKGSGESPSA